MDYWVWIVVAVFILVVIGIIAYLWYQTSNGQTISTTAWWVIIAVLVIMIIIIVIVAVFAGTKKTPPPPKPPQQPMVEVNNFDTPPQQPSYTLVAQQPQMMVAQQPTIDLISAEGGYIPPANTGLVPGVGGRSTVNMQPRTVVLQQQPVMVQQGLRRTGVTANGIPTQASVASFNGPTSFNPDPTVRVQTIPQQTFRASVLENGVPKTGVVRTGGGTRVVTQDQLPHQVQVVG